MSTYLIAVRQNRLRRRRGRAELKPPYNKYELAIPYQMRPTSCHKTQPKPTRSVQPMSTPNIIT